MQDMEEFLNTELGKLPEFVSIDKKEVRFKEKVLTPDEEGHIYQVSGLCGVTIDIVSSLRDAENLARREKHAWTFVQIWAIAVDTGRKYLISQRQLHMNNPLGKIALLHAKGEV